MKTVIALPQFLRKRSSIFKFFPQFDKVIYCGLSREKTNMFLTIEGSRESKMLIASFIRQDEAELWGACQELFKDILTSIEPALHGIFHFELLSVEMSQKLEAFQWKEFAKGMTDLSREIPTGETRFVQYCSILGVLTKHADEDYGKISFKPHVNIFYNEPAEIAQDLERMVKEQLSDTSFKGRCRLIFYDLSRQPLYSSQNFEQSVQLQRLSRRLDANRSSTINEIAIIDTTGLHELFKQSQLEMDFS